VSVIERQTVAGRAPGGQTARSAGAARLPRRLLRRIPRAAWICALVATINAVAWSIVTPPFQAPDEPSHFAYVQHLAETGHLPSSSKEVFAPAEAVALEDLHQAEVRFSQENPTISTLAQQRLLERGLALPLSRSTPGDAGLAASQPPLYYALETVPYELGTGGSVLDRLELMRLLSALMGGACALLTFLFLREALPAAPWAWTVGGLSVALMPSLGTMSGAVSPDALLAPIATALFYLLARGFRRGLSAAVAVALGATIAAGCLAKLTFLALLPGAIFGCAVLVWRAARAGRLPSARSLTLAGGVAVLPAAAYGLRDASAAQPSANVVSGAFALHGQHTIGGALSYMWQLYLPRLPGMDATFHGINGSLLWFEALVGQYGWIETTFPWWVVRIAFVPAALLGLLCVCALVANRGSLWARRLELASYGAISLGLLVAIGLDEYLHGAQGEYLQLRYLLPLVALAGAGLALAARGAGRRWGPVAGALIVTLMLGHDLFSQLLVISRYYG